MRTGPAIIGVLIISAIVFILATYDGPKKAVDATSLPVSAEVRVWANNCKTDNCSGDVIFYYNGAISIVDHQNMVPILQLHKEGLREHLTKLERENSLGLITKVSRLRGDAVSYQNAMRIFHARKK